jgi:hypothetical protein
MTDRPIIFNGEMVRAILEGRKTQTRRVINPQPWMEATRCETYHDSRTGGTGVCFFQNHLAIGDANVLSPYGHSGDHLWVRETWFCHRDLDEIVPRDCMGSDIWYTATQETKPADAGKTRPSIFMPLWASRITLEIVRVSVQRVQDIGDDSCEAEGISLANASIPGMLRKRFSLLWDSINAKRGFGWDVNPWVWVVSFKVDRLET